MKAETTVAAEGDIRYIPLSELHESPWNPRQYYPDRAMAELVESMRQGGFRSWLPLMVRPIAGDGAIPSSGGYEIGAGHRRSRAAIEAGLVVVPCIVREMSDEEFLDVLNFDNSGREDVHPLHEAAGWKAWMEKTGKGVVDIAARIGQSIAYVYQRLKYSALIEDGCKAFLDGQITAGHAILIARLQPKEQKSALKFLEPDWRGGRPGVRELAAFIMRDVHLDMRSARFDTESATLLAGAGPCTTCQKRTINSVDLPVEIGSAGDECTDPGCFKMKLTNYLVQIRADLAGKHPEIVDVSSAYTKPPKNVLGPSQYQIVKKGDKDSKPAIVTDGAAAGTVIYIKERPKASSSQDSWEKQEEKRKAEEARATAAADRERPIRLAVLKAIWDQASAGFATTDLRAALAALLATDSSSGQATFVAFLGIKVANRWQAKGDLLKHLPRMPDADIIRLALVLPCVDEFDERALAKNAPAPTLMGLAKRFKVDAVKIRRQIEEAAKEAEGGTRREVEKPSKAKAPAPAKKKPAPVKKAKPAKPAKSAGKKKK